MSQLLLGKKVSYSSSYDPDLLFPIKRSMNRDKLSSDIKFEGVDIWNCYEVSWLNQKGKPEVAIIELYIPATTPNIVESKSLKLYLNSFNNEKFLSFSEVQNIIKNDLEKAIGGKIDIIFRSLDCLDNNNFKKPQATCLDNIDTEIHEYNVNPSLLEIVEGEEKSDTVFTDLFRSNCLITNQPDWASVIISYRGYKINHESLLKYLVSYRNHDEFHEHCVERIYADILTICKPKELFISARFTRRGGVDINPIRSSSKLEPGQFINQRLVRQ